MEQFLKDNRESEQNGYSLFTVRNAKHAMTAFAIFAIAITVIIFFHGLLIKHKLPITLNTIVGSFSAVVGNVSNVLSGATLLTILLEGADIMFFRRTRAERAKLKEEKRRNILGEVMAGDSTDIDTLLEKVNNLIESGQITVGNDRFLSPMHCLQWGLTYKIYDCLYEHGSLTPAEIHSIIKDSDPDTIGHTLERMSLIGITQPVNYADLTRADLPIRGLDLLQTLNERKKWELTEYIRE